MKKLEIVDDATFSTASYSEDLTFDARGRVSQVVNSLGTFNYSYVGQSTRTSTVDYPNGMRVTCGYYGPTGDEFDRILKDPDVSPSDKGLVRRVRTTIGETRTRAFAESSGSSAMLKIAGRAALSLGLLAALGCAHTSHPPAPGPSWIRSPSPSTHRLEFHCDEAQGSAAKWWDRPPPERAVLMVEHECYRRKVSIRDVEEMFLATLRGFGHSDVRMLGRTRLSPEIAVATSSFEGHTYYLAGFLDSRESLWSVARVSAETDPPECSDLDRFLLFLAALHAASGSDLEGLVCAEVRALPTP